MSETVRRTTSKRKSGSWGICDARKLRPARPSRLAHFSQRQTKILSPVASPQGVSKGTSMSYCPRLSFSSHSFPANRITTFSFAYTMRNGLKITENGRFLENRKQKYGGNICNQFFDHGFLSDFYSDRGSTAAPFGHSNVSWCGLGKFSGKDGEVQFWSFSNFDCLWNKHQKSERSDVWNLGERRTLYSNQSKCQAYIVALRRQWRQKSKLFKIGKFKHPSITQRACYSHIIFIFAIKLGVLVDYQVLAHWYSFTKIHSAPPFPQYLYGHICNVMVWRQGQSSRTVSCVFCIVMCIAAS